MDNKRIHYIFAGLTFLIALTTYTLTMQPTVAFWDCGEFAAAAWALQIPHPPGAPLWTLVGRIGMMLPFFSDLVARYNFLSVLSSALTVMLLYLTSVHLLKMWRGVAKTTAEAFSLYGAAFIGAVAFVYTDSFWFNALESEVYAFGSLFIALIPWLVLVWHDHAEELHSEKYLLLIAYVIGLSMGVHQLALLTLYPVFMVVYYRRRQQVTLTSWLMMAGAAVLAFVIAFKVVLSQLVNWLGTSGWPISVFLLAGGIAGIVWSQKRQKPVWNIALWSAILLFLGYSTYTMIMVRAASDPPMNQNDPSNFKRVTRYINREQYGSAPIIPRRIESQRSNHGETWSDYSSDFDFFLRYQTNFMFNRYLLWNFVGRTSDEQGAGVDFRNTWGLALALGLFGLFWHFKQDPKRALAMLAMFVLMGWFTAWYQNQQEPQPRERDYFYVGAYYVFAIWIAIGASGIFELLRERLAARPESGEGAGLIYGFFAALLILVPLNLCLGLAGLATGRPLQQTAKWAEYSRFHNYIPFDYAYNILQSCPKNAVLFTYGDNDTFPVWCLQDVYAIRRDVRVVQLSLSNLFWYVDGLRRTNSWGGQALKLPSMPDELVGLDENDQASYRFFKWDEKQLNVPVTAEIRSAMLDSAVSAGSLSVSITPRSLSDQVISDLVEYNIDRPLCFSITVPESSLAGLSTHLLNTGLVGRVTTEMFPQAQDPLEVPLSYGAMKTFALTTSATPSVAPKLGAMIRTFGDPSANFSALDAQYSLSYRLMYMRLARAALQRGDKSTATAAMDTLALRVPPERVALDFPYAAMGADLYQKLGDKKGAARYAHAGLASIEALKQFPNWQESRLGRAASMPYIEADLYEKAGDYAQAKSRFATLSSQHANDAYGGYYDIRARRIDATVALEKGDTAAARAIYQRLVEQYGNREDLPEDVSELRATLRSLQGGDSFMIR